MSDQGRQASEFGDRLAELAGIAGRAAGQPPAQAIRRRGQRRVLRQRAAGVASVVVLLAAGALGARYVAPAHPAQLPAAILTATPSTAPSGPGTPSSTVTPPARSSSPASPSVSPCRRPGVVVSVGGQDAGSGHRGVVLVFTNAGSQACRLSGYPGVAGLDAGGGQVAQARRTPSGYLGGLGSGGPAPVVTLAAGQSASALVEALAFNSSDGSSCTAFAGLLVTVPDDTVSTRLSWGNDGCSDLQVHPVVAGTTGRAG